MTFVDVAGEVAEAPQFQFGDLRRRLDRWCENLRQVKSVGETWCEIVRDGDGQKIADVFTLRAPARAIGTGCASAGAGHNATLPAAE